MTRVFAAALVLTFAAGPAIADSKKWRANNHSNHKVKVFWVADGCAGVKPACDQDGDNLVQVCKTKILHPGESAEYQFAGGTYNRRKEVCSMDRKSNTVGTTTRTANGIECDNRCKWTWD